MKRKFTILTTIISLLIGGAVYARTPDFVSGYNNYKWGTDISKQPHFVKVSNITPFQYKNTTVYKHVGEDTIILNSRKVIRAEEVLYVVINGKLEVVYIVISRSNPKMVQDFYFLKSFLQDYYGKPSEVTDTGREVFYNREGASLKLSMGKYTKMIIYAPAYKNRAKTYQLR